MRVAQPWPCRTCPFRADQPFYLEPGKTDEIHDHLAAGGGHVCHGTYGLGPRTQPDGADRRRQCAGALATLRADERGLPLWARIFAAGGHWNPTELDGAPVHAGLGAWRAAMHARHAAVAAARAGS